MLTFDYTGIASWLGRDEFSNSRTAVELAHKTLHDNSDRGMSGLGWLKWPLQSHDNFIEKINNVAEQVRSTSQVFVVIGAGGSFLGAKAVIELLGQPNNLIVSPGHSEIYFVGHDLSTDSLSNLLRYLQDKDFSINIISKSGFTLEPAIAFRVLKQHLEERYGVEAAKHRTFVTTDPSEGSLRLLSEQEGYVSFDIPSDIGGRYSVLTAVGLLPIAVAGINISELLSGAQQQALLLSNPDLSSNESYQYALLRHLLYRKGKSLEILINFDPAFRSIGSWWQQLFAESEGKEYGGIFPTLANCSADLHSLGQYMQSGLRNIFETVLVCKSSNARLEIPTLDSDYDNLNYIAGHTIDDINNILCQGMQDAHSEGGVPNMRLTLQNKDAFCVGALLYFFMKSCALGCYLSGINPFDQPGVEIYKKHTMHLISKFLDQK